jgi:hypothetical protein
MFGRGTVVKNSLLVALERVLVVLLMVRTKETLNLGPSSHGIVKFIVYLVFKMGHVLL